MDIFYEVLKHITLITDLRNLMRTCKNFRNYISLTFSEFESNNKGKWMKYNFSKNMGEYSVESFTIEIVLDKYYHLLPERYFNKKTLPYVIF
jgi:hypothetical protein